MVAINKKLMGDLEITVVQEPQKIGGKQKLGIVIPHDKKYYLYEYIPQKFKYDDYKNKGTKGKKLQVKNLEFDPIYISDGKK